MFLIVGDGPFLEQLKKMAQRLKIEHNIIFTGRVSSQKVAAYYQAADIFLFASFTDTQGIVLLEALASGLPTVVLKDDAFSGVVLDNKNGFSVSPKIPKIFAKKAMTLLEDQELYKEFSTAAVGTASKFSDMNSAKNLLKI